MKTSDILAIGLMTFAMFLGAGNIIFPPFLGLEAGQHLLPAMGGFLITAVGLPALTLVVFGRLNDSKLLTHPLPAGVATAMWVAILTAVGPAFSMPRAVTVAYEMGIAPFVSDNCLPLFSFLFCLVTLILAFRPGKLVDYIGKVMTPMLIILLAILAIYAMVSPLALPPAPQSHFIDSALTQGLVQGYMTMDAIAAVGFGWVVIKTIHDKGVTQTKAVSRITCKVALIYAVLMGACYIALGYVGATSAPIAEGVTNGGELLTRYVAHTFGDYGQWLLAAIIIMACLTTTVGLTNACTEYYEQTFNVPFRRSATIVIIATGLIANIGLNQILAVSLPAILILCPVAIALVLTAFVYPGDKRYSAIYVTTLFTAFAFGSIDAISILGMMPVSMDHFFEQWLPLYSAHATWLLPCLSILLFCALPMYRQQANSAVSTQS
ncbi:branched-chain amino acid transport system II carrier protein [Photobacterium aphoticum]|uniref:Branched-chain amino acid transport system carrier protein n=1 Tax=Photobacterium aphoticum TaxID=754436 RepID=A0A0J1GTK8_9GAMM|nr:branched-chain amino acid transport system II carrier protein [Photobacterium aphoticum]KLV03075.1 branched-chain amino acid transporter [Photobacterium aphoticum]PSU58007.1 branched-chain amino acid transport system II carrier protein [Photobacterium aphoticum]GHA52223.1 branched-chain amino acid transport system carrier protein [Photobacterium aphoticum]